MRTYEERFNYELNKMTDRNAQKKFFSGAINRMKFAYDPEWVDDQKEFACDVLCTCGFCLHVDCTQCILEANYQRAKEEIAMGARRKLVNDRKSPNYVSYRTNNM